ncbi:MAG: NPCBM/NEW2 domain-containing protein [Candidatus Lernaella stagnicola]|nr:NPCBM/NEW2 domain-containing protein [Candidatus Lernaella stagnicola]
MKKVLCSYWPLFLASIFLLVGTLPEVCSPFVDVNDSNLHQISATTAAERIINFQNPIDFFMPEWACGFPLFGHYQFLPQLVLAVLYLITLKLFSISTLYHVLVALLLSATPWVYYYSSRLFGFSRIASLFAGVLSLTVFSISGFGHELNAYLAFGTGLFTQLFGMVVFPLALGFSWRWARGEYSKLTLPLMILIAMTVSHVFLVYLFAINIALWWAVGLLGSRVSSAKKLIALAVSSVAATAFFLLPMVLNSPYHASSRFEPLSKINGNGLQWVLENLVHGNLFDSGRLPLLTGLVLIGLVISIRKGAPHIAIAISFTLSLLLFAGRTTWGSLLDFLPMAKDLHFERFILGMHYFGVVLSGIALSWLWSKFQNYSVRKRRLSYLVVLIGVLGLFYAPFTYFIENRKFVETATIRFKAEAENSSRLLNSVLLVNPNRIYAGPRNGWGTKFPLNGAPAYFSIPIGGMSVIGHLPFGWSLPGDFTLTFDPFRWEELDLYAVSHIFSWRDDSYWGLSPLLSKENRAVYSTPAGGSMFRVVDTPILLKANKYTYWDSTYEWLKSPLPKRGQFIQVAFDSPPKKSFALTIEAVSRLHQKIVFLNAHGKHNRVRRPIYGKPILADLFSQEFSKGSVLDESVGETSRVTVYAQQPSAVLFKKSFHPFWRARVDGKAIKPFMVSPGFLAVEVSEGEHVVEFYYRPPWWKWALFMLLPLSVIVTCIRDRRWMRHGKDANSTKDMARVSKIPLYFFVLAIPAALIMAKTVFDRSTTIDRLPPVGERLRRNEPTKQVERIYSGQIPFDSGLTVTTNKQWVKIFRLHKRYESFEAWVSAVPIGSCEEMGSVKFEIFADNKRISRPMIIDKTTFPKYVCVPLNSAEMLELRATPLRPTNSCFYKITWAEGALR